MASKLLHDETPFNSDGTWSKSWHGSAKSIDDASTDLPHRNDILEVLYESAPKQDHGVAIVKLKDGRLMAYESYEDVTGSGFHEDAYGGDADVWFSRPENLNTLILEALTDNGRELCGIPREGLSK